MIEIGSHEPSQGGKAEAMTENAPSSAALGLHLFAVLGVSAAVAALVGGTGAAVSTVLGVGLAALNLAVMRRIVRALTAQSGLGALWALAFPVKLVALVGGAFVLVQRGIAHPVPLAIGFALLPLSSVLLRRGSGSASVLRTALAPHTTSLPGAQAPQPARSLPGAQAPQPARSLPGAQAPQPARSLPGAQAPQPARVLHASADE